MTDPDLTEAQQEAVRRLLAEARHDEPMPAGVAARLDDVVSGLSAARQGGGDVVGLREGSGPTPGSAGIAPGSSAGDDRPRRWPAYLLSAAAVVAIGFGVTQVLPDDTDNGADTTSAGEKAEVAPDAPDKAQDVAPTESMGEPPTQDLNKSPDPSLAAPPLPDIPGLAPAEQAASDATKLDRRYAARLSRRCLPDDVPTASALRPATYRGKEAVVVYLPPGDAERRVEVYVCGSTSDDPAATSSVPLGE